MPRLGRHIRSALPCLLGLLGWGGMLGEGRALAAGPIGRDGSLIRTSDYTIDQFQGPVLASSRITALGGAYAGLAEGAEGITVNPASVSLRYPYSTTRDDYDLTGGVTFPSSVRGTDFDNNGQRGFPLQNFVFGTLGGYVQHDRWGVGSSVSVQQYQLGSPAGAPQIKEMLIRVFRADAVFAHAFHKEQVHLGVGLRATYFGAIDATASEVLLFGNAGVGGQAGALWTPHDLPLRIGATFRTPVVGIVDPNSNQPDPAGDRVVGTFYLPSRSELPWEFEWGLSLQLGERPINLPWYDEDRLAKQDPTLVDSYRRIQGGMREPAFKAARRILKERYRSIPRRKLLLTTSALVSGTLGQAVGIESMLEQVVARSGARTTLTLRGGAEAELFPDRLQFRAGTYMEPTRFFTSSPRLHGTTGFEVRMFESTIFGLYPENTSFRASAAIDVARDYFGWSVGLGIWR